MDIPGYAVDKPTYKKTQVRPGSECLASPFAIRSTTGSLLVMPMASSSARIAFACSASCKAGACTHYIHTRKKIRKGNLSKITFLELFPKVTNKQVRKGNFSKITFLELFPQVTIINKSGKVIFQKLPFWNFSQQKLLIMYPVAPRARLFARLFATLLRFTGPVLRCGCGACWAKPPGQHKRYKQEPQLIWNIDVEYHLLHDGFQYGDWY